MEQNRKRYSSLAKAIVIGLQMIAAVVASVSIVLFSTCLLYTSPRLQMLGYRRINFLSHRYFMLYRIEEDIVFIDNIFHELQDYENRMM